MTQVHSYLGDVLIRERILSRQELEEVMEKSRLRNLTLEETLFRLGYISKDRLGALYAQVYSAEHLSALPRPAPDEVIRAISPEQAWELQALPYQFDDKDTLAVLMAGPFERLSYEETVAELERITGKKIRAAFCSISLLQELLLKYYGAEKQPSGPGAGNFSAVIESIRSDSSDEELRAEFEELYDVGQTALIAARSHPFNRAVGNSIEEAKQKLSDAQKFMDSDFEEEAVQMASQAVQLLKEASQKADAAERDWEKLVQQVKSLRAKVSSLEEEGAAQFAPAEFRELSQIRESLIECINDRNVDKLRYLLDQGMIIIERVNLLSPNRNKDREEVMSSLTQVRQVIARARKAGSREFAPELLKEAYAFLDRAESSARRSRWDEVRSALAAPEDKAVEAEKAAIGAVEEAKQLTLKLREAIRAASGALEQAMAHAFAQEAIDELIGARDAIAEAKTCFEDGRQQRGISLAEAALKQLKERIIPLIEEAERNWNDLFRRTDECSAKIRAFNIPLMLKLKPAKVEALLHAERDMVASLCSRDRDKLSAAVSACESLLAEVEESYAEATDQLKSIEAVVLQATELLRSAASTGIEADVAPDFVQAALLLENTRRYLAEGNTQEAADSAHAATEHIRLKVIEPQGMEREQWADLILESAAILEEAGKALSVDASYHCAEDVETYFSNMSGLISAFATRNPEALRQSNESLRASLDSIRNKVSDIEKTLFQNMTTELREVEQAVKRAVERCSGYYAPDALESVYLDIKRLWQMLSEASETLDVASELDIRRNLAVARAKLWQVDFLRERFEREREEDLRQLRLKMDAAREEVEACINFDFVAPDSPLLAEARSLLEQSENSFIEGDIEGTFELARQTRTVVSRILAEAGDKEKRWKELAESLRSQDAGHNVVLREGTSSGFAAEEFDNLSELVEKTEEIIERKNIELLIQHGEQLASTTNAIRERVKTGREALRREVEQAIQEAREQIKLGRVLHAEETCADLFAAACSYDEIASRYLVEEDFTLALEAAADALSKASEAVRAAKAGVERAGSLAADYMNIASKHIAQGNSEAAAEALRKGLSLVKTTQLE